MATAPDALSVAAGTPSPEAQAVAQPTPAMPTAPPSSSGSLWGNVLKGALIGLMGGASAPTAGVAFGRGAAAAESQIQNDKVQAAQDKANSQKAQDAHMLASAQYANATLNHQILQANYDKMPKNLQQELEQKQWESASQLENMGALVGNPYKSQGDAMAAATAFNQSAAQKGDKFTHAVVLERQDGTYGVYSPTDQKNSQPIDIILADGSKVTVPAGQMDGKTYLSTQVGIAKDKFDKSVQQAQQAETSRHNKAMESIAQQKEDTAETKGAEGKPDLLMGAAPDGSQVAGTAAELKAAGIANPMKMPSTEAGKVMVARQLIAPNGLFQSVANDLQNLQAKGKLGVAASRWNDFMAGKVGDGDPDFQSLKTNMGLLGTALMQAHVGARGSHEMLEHFQKLADYRISSPENLQAALKAEFHYVHEKAALIPKPQGQ